MGRDLSLERAWRDHIGRQRRSGLTIHQFCEQEGLVAHQFSWWKRELNQRDAQSDQPPGAKKRRRRRHRRRVGPGFVAVQVAPSLSSTPLEIIVDQRLRIAVTAGFDHQLLAEVVRVLESRQC